jgi:hypothetical protein
MNKEINEAKKKLQKLLNTLDHPELHYRAETLMGELGWYQALYNKRKADQDEIDVDLRSMCSEITKTIEQVDNLKLYGHTEEVADQLQIQFQGKSILEIERMKTSAEMILENDGMCAGIACPECPCVANDDYSCGIDTFWSIGREHEIDIRKIRATDFLETYNSCLKTPY